MKANHYTAEQIIKILEQAERGEQTVGAVCREHGVAEATFYRWRKTYAGMSVAEAQRLKELEKLSLWHCACKGGLLAKVLWHSTSTQAARGRIAKTSDLTEQCGM